MEKRIVLIELYGGHFECLYSQYYYLKNEGYKIYLIARKKAFFKLSDMEFEDRFLFEADSYLKWLKTLFSIRSFLKKNDIDLGVINTAENNRVRDLLLFCNVIPYTGIIHHIKKISSSFTQKIISKKIKQYLTLNDYLSDIINQANNISVRVSTLYSIVYPTPLNNSVIKPKDEIWIAVPGSIELKRRNYKDLITSVSKANLTKIKFLFLGKGDRKDIATIKKDINDLEVNDRFIIFDKFLDNNTFFSYLNLCDYIIPLIHEDLSQEYRYNRISGCFNIAFGLKKPILMENNFSNIDDFKPYSIFYKHHELTYTLQQIEKDNEKNISLLTSKIDRYEKHHTLNTQTKYIEVIKSNIRSSVQDSKFTWLFDFKF